MTHHSTVKNKARHYYTEKRELTGLMPIHKWLLVSASVLIFVVLPMLIVWSSLGIIHPRANEPISMFSDTPDTDQATIDLSR